jgi:hypothetical protein
MAAGREPISGGALAALGRPVRTALALMFTPDRLFCKAFVLAIWVLLVVALVLLLLVLTAVPVLLISLALVLVVPR